MSMGYDGPSPPATVSREIFFSELLKKPASVILSIHGPVYGVVDGEKPNRIVHNMLDDDDVRHYPSIAIPGLNMCVEIKCVEEVKKILYWLEQQSYSSREVETNMIDPRPRIPSTYCHVHAYFDLQNNFFDDIPAGVDGFKDI